MTIKLPAVAVLLVFLTIFGSDCNAWALNGSPMFFQPPSYGSGGFSAYASAVGDFNGDGIPDVAITNDCANAQCTASSVSVLLGNGHGGFQTAVSYLTGGVDPLSVAVGDFNNDGILDLAVANYYAVYGSTTGEGSVSVFLGNGDGTFRAAQSFLTSGLDTYTVAVGDFNRDGKLDLVATNYCAGSGCANGSVSLLLGNGDGTFQAAQTFSSGGLYATAVAVGDFNGDGILDLAVGNENGGYTGGAVNVFLGSGDGTFKAGQVYSTGGLVVSITAGDVNGDGKKDLVAANACLGNCTDVQAAPGIAVLLGNGDGTFQTAAPYSSGGFGVYSVALADMNGDGKVDLVVGDNNSVGVLLGNGDGTFQAATLYSSPFLYSIVVSDMDGDGNPDVVAVSNCQFGSYNVCFNGSASVLLGNGDGSLEGERAFNTAGNDSQYVAVGDLNGDGNLDLVTADVCPSSNNCHNDSVSVILGNGDGTFQAPQSYLSGGVPGGVSVNIADLNGDGKPDLLVTNACDDANCDGTISVLLGNGDGSFQAEQTYASGGEDAIASAVADFNGDGKLDVVTSNGKSATLGVLLGRGDGSFQAAQTYSSGATMPRPVAVGDFNGDGKTDIVVAGSGFVGVLLGNGDGTFKPAVTYSSEPSTAIAMAIADLNKDGKLDLVIGNYNSIGVLLGNGDGTFQAVQTYAPGWNMTYGDLNSILVDDFNGDGKVDVLANGSYTSSLLPGKGDGTLQPAILYSPGGTWAVGGDFNGDGKTDLVVLGNSLVTFLSNVSAGSKQSTATRISSSLNPSGINEAVTFTARVTTGLFAPATGTVTFKDGSNSLGTVTLSSGRATLTTSALAGGAQSITVAYSGDTNHQASSAVLTQTVELATTTTSLASSANPSISGTALTFTAAISTNGPGTPTGTVTFNDGNNAIGTGTLSNGTASLTTSALAVGGDSITAIYGGDSNNNGSASVPLVQTIEPADFAVSAAPPTLTMAAGQPGTITVTVMPQGSFTDQINLSCSGLPQDASCSFQPSSLTPNSNTVSSKLTITTMAASASLVPPWSRHTRSGHRSADELRPVYSMWLILPGMLLSTVGLAGPRRKRSMGFCLIFLLVGACLLQSACGGANSSSSSGGGGGTPAGTYTITITGASTSTHTATVTVTVK